jgi:hypothetical protein
MVDFDISLERDEYAAGETARNTCNLCREGLKSGVLNFPFLERRE